MTKKLVIVESPTKARTISGYLGSEYIVESSIGHIRDLPRNAADVPASVKGESWARLGVDVDNGFKPLYIIPTDKKKQVTKLKQLLKQSDEVYLATDEDREGESIAWHLLEVLKPKVPTRRMVFHEITPEAIQHAIDNPREIDRALVDAQEARRVLDRLYGYEVSPVLWKKVKPRLSAGRVQSPATRIIVQRERERMAFTAAAYFGLEATFGVPDEGQFTSELVSVAEQRIATGKDFTADGTLAKPDAVLVLDESAADELQAELATANYTVKSLETKPYTRKPYPPFRTSTLQQEAGRKLRFSSGRTMRAAQRLYENGFITYMRTDSTTLSETALIAARNLVAAKYGKEYLPETPRSYAGKVKNAQEAHEAIRPSGDEFQDPVAIADTMGSGTDEAKLYDLIWKRTVASQMRDARGESVRVRISGMGSSRREALFAASGRTIQFPGFLRAYVEGSDDPDADLEDRERHLPTMAEGDNTDLIDLEAKPHATKPPARYSEPSLIQRLEELGIGRPSTYASIISTIQDRGYVYKKGGVLVPTLTAFSTVALLEQHFDNLVDYAFTARMEDDLDRIARGEEEATPWLERFYFGNGHKGLKELANANLEEIDARAINSIPLGVDSDGVLVVARTGRYGPYVQRGEQSASIPEDIAPDELTVELAIEFLEKPSDDRQLGNDPDSDLPIYVKNGRYGPYVQLGELDDDTKVKPKTASLFKTMTVEAVDLATALKLLSQPRLVGSDPEDSNEIFALNGRYGPYLKKGTDTRSLTEEDAIFTVTLDEALALFAQPKKRGRGAAKPPLKELGEDPNSGKPVVIKDGRFGPYVTDGETNASLRAGDTIDGVDMDRATELLAERRAKLGAAPKKKPAAKKKAAAKKKPAAKKKVATKKKAAAKKKPAAKKTPAETAPDSLG